MAARPVPPYRHALPHWRLARSVPLPLLQPAAPSPLPSLAPRLLPRARLALPAAPLGWGGSPSTLSTSLASLSDPSVRRPACDVSAEPISASKNADKSADKKGSKGQDDFLYSKSTGLRPQAPPS